MRRPYLDRSGRLHAYPLTVVFDRYGGVYSGGKWIAWPLEPHEVPDAPDSGDLECGSFWGDIGADDSIDCGKGKTAQEAIDNLGARFGGFCL